MPSETDGGLNKWHSTKIPSLAKVLPTCRAKPAPSECPAMHTLLLPCLSIADLSASRAPVNLTEPLKLSRVKNRKSSSRSLTTVDCLSTVPLMARTTFGAPLGLNTIKSDSAASWSHSRSTP
uniref:Uncharacterized protein n=1 Tax=Leersia perrieri TaxID=77586 RepID=A0A0D9UYY4_9ORYZ